MESAHIVQYLYASAALGHLTAAHCRELLQGVIERDLLPNLTLVQAKARFLLKVTRRRAQPLDSSAGVLPTGSLRLLHCCNRQEERYALVFPGGIAGVVDSDMACWGLTRTRTRMDHRWVSCWLQPGSMYHLDVLQQPC